MQLKWVQRASCELHAVNRQLCTEQNSWKPIWGCLLPKVYGLYSNIERLTHAWSTKYR
jgi:hypothetical protein